MFQYEEPLFEKKRLLRIEMLEQLRDYPRDYLKILYQEYSEGIVSGCHVSWETGKLTISPGIIYRGKNLYFMVCPYTMECGAEDKVRYLKVQFLTEVKENEKILGNTRIVLDEEKPNLAYEMELCRFRLQEGARLRDTYENFEDYSTPYDTINLIHSPYASNGKATLRPEILRSFAKEIMQNKGAHFYDVSFAINILANQGIVTEACIRAFLDLRIGEQDDGNDRLFEGLLEVLKSQEIGTPQKKGSRDNKRQVMLF